MTRMIVSQLLQSLAVNNMNKAELDASSIGSSDDATLSSCSSSCAGNDRISRKLANLTDESPLNALNLSVPANGRSSNGAAHRGGTTTMSTKDVQALEQIRVRLEEFHFDTGIPRLVVHPNVTNVVFPSLATFLRSSLTTGASPNRSAASEDSVVNNRSSDSNEADFSSRSGVYAALTHYYAFPLRLDK
ncbi:unnamed protein product [Peronospora destructor]|uniref:Uncharacterized protein n=1 Tax=Peronospora destructor TaxID=86335 RepID=A0AAV0UN31_9STRA|nr:unnamed protein product [Peronospora destructor]